MQHFLRSVSDNAAGIACSASVLALGIYVLFTRIRPSLARPKKNLLQTTLESLRLEKRAKNVIKIVVTEQASSKGHYRRCFVKALKQLLAQTGIPALINCSPQKLLKSSCECFLQSYDQREDPQHSDYYYSAMRIQYVVEDTIERLALLKRANRDRPMVMICDNNLLDVKASCANLTLWGTFLEANSLRERDLQGHYDLVLHLSDEDCPGNELQRLQCIWKDFPSYHHFSYDSAQSSELNVRQPLMVVSDYLGLGREDCNLQHNIAQRQVLNDAHSQSPNEGGVRNEFAIAQMRAS